MCIYKTYGSIGGISINYKNLIVDLNYIFKCFKNRKV